MKNKLNAIFLLVTFPLLLIGGNEGNIVLSTIGIGLLLVNAGTIAIQPLLLHKKTK